MKGTIQMACLFGLSYILAAAPAFAQAPTQSASPKAATTVHLVGCPMKGVETGCLVLKSSGQTYDITGAAAQVDPANPQSPPAPPRVGYLGITLDGTISSGSVGTCMQGPILKDIKWTYTRERCKDPDSNTK